jgi:glycosyltransferase involved in cell wall biosynthesis
MKACVVIPTYNEARAIADLVRQIRSQNLEVIIVDDGSQDSTSEMAERSGATVLRNQVNQGKGASLIKGFSYALEKEFDAVITMDGDGQHLPSEIPYFLRIAVYSDNDILVGNRMLKRKNMPFIRVLTNKIMSGLISKIARQNVPDTQCGFRLIKRRVLEKIRLKTFKYETESEILIRAAHLGFKIESVPVKTVYLGEKSQINPFIDTWRFIRFILKELWTLQS